MNINGKIIKIDETETFTNFSKRSFVLEVTDNPKYPQLISLQFILDKCPVLDHFQIGDSVDVAFNLQGREWVNPENGESKYFNTLQAWKINKLEAEPENINPMTGQNLPSENFNNSKGDGIPF